MKFKVLVSVLSGILFVLGMVFLGRPALAVDPAVLGNKYKVSFPIAELSNCTDYSSCRNYCEDPIHASACIDFAKKKGFYQEEPAAKFVAVLATAKSVLGCDSLESCQNFCQIPTNHDKCNSFARNAGLAGGYINDPGKREVLSKAEGKLGCGSAEECKGFCDKPENRAKCEAFAKEVGLVGGTHVVGPGGCTSQDSCRSFCSDPGNFSICRNFAGLTGVGGFKGPGGCDSESSCKTYCNSHLEECPGFNREGGSNYGAVEMCNRTPNCSWKGDSCSCESNVSTDPAAACARYGCVWKNGACGCTSGAVTTNSNVGGTAPPGGTMGCTPPTSLSFCGAGKHFSYSSCRCEDDSAGGCTTQWGCPSGMSWNDSTCDCRTPSGDWHPPASGSYSGGGSSMSRESQETTCRQGGGTCVWNGDICSCRGYVNPNPSCQPPQNGCGGNKYWDQAACTCRDTSSYVPTMSRESQDATCRAGGGTCDWTSGTCYCRGYQTAPSNVANPPTSPTMTRESQQSACNACGGTCNWNGDTCACQCKTSATPTTTQTSGAQSAESACKATAGCTWNGSSCQCGSSSPTTTTPTTAPAPAPAPAPSTDPATACGQTSGCSWTGSTCQCGTAQGVSTQRGLLQIVLDFFTGLLRR